MVQIENRYLKEDCMFSGAVLLPEDFAEISFDCFVKLVKNEGVFALWKGFTPYFLRIGPHTIFTFLFLEQLNKLFAKYYMKQDV